MRTVVALLSVAAALPIPRLARADLTLPPTVVQSGHSADKTVRAGFLDATLYGADPTGKQDSTKAIQAAIDDGRDYLMTTFLPAGTYLISETLTGAENGSGSGGSFCYQLQSNTGSAYSNEWVAAQAPTLVGPPSGGRAVLKLADGASGFGDPSSPKPAVHFVDQGPSSQYVNATVGAFDCLMYSVIRDVDIDLGSGNAGAVGVQFYAAQYSYMANVTIRAGSAYAGIQGAPATSDWVNLDVEGGQYGILLDYAGTSSLAGVSLSNQTTAALSLSGDGAITLAGFHVVEPSGAGITVSPFNGVPQMASVVLFDGDIEVGSGTHPAIANAGGIDLLVQNVWISGSGPLVQSGSQAPVMGSGATDLVTEYAYTDPAQTGGSYAPATSYDLVDGVQGQAGISKVQMKAGASPGDLVLRHLPGPLPWFDDPGVVDVTTLGADPTGTSDSTSAIQKAVDQSLGHGDSVFLPRGNYLVSGTIALHPDTRFFGVPGPKSTLFASTWNPGGKLVPFLQTADTPTGKTFVADVQIMLPDDDTDGIGYAQSYLGAIDWRAGRSSVLWQPAVNLEPDWNTTSQSSTAPRSLIHVEGSGGGRFYGIQQAGNWDNARDDDPGFRFLFIDGTSAPLTLYGPNFEHGLTDAFVEIANAKNVRVFETKTECRTTWAAIESSQNVLVAGVGGDWAPATTGISSTDSSDVEAAALGWYADETGGWYVYRTGGSLPDAGIPYADAVSVFQDGTFDETPFPHCGDQVCDGAETSANCAQDCGAGADAGTSSDAGMGPDAHPVGEGGSGQASVDGGSDDDGSSGSNGAAPSGSSSGCACSAVEGGGAGGMSGAGGLAAVVAIGALLIRRRRAAGAAVAACLLAGCGSSGGSAGAAGDVDAGDAGAPAPGADAGSIAPESGPDAQGGAHADAPAGGGGSDASDHGQDASVPDAGSASGAGFPRLGSLLIATTHGATNMGYDADYVTWASKIHVNVFGANWTGAGVSLYGGSRDAFVKAVHAQSKIGARMFQYFVTDNTSTPWPVTDVSGWELYQKGTSGTCSENSYFNNPSICNTNQTLFTPADSDGLHLEGLFAKTLVATLVDGSGGDAAPSLDGTFHDNTILVPTVAGDYGRNGQQEQPGDATAGQWLRAGFAEGYTYLQKNSPFITIGNLGGWGIPNGSGGGLDVSGLTNIVQGGIVEGVFGESWSIDTWGTFAETEAHYQFCMQNTKAPKLVVIHAENIRTDGSGPTAWDSSGNPSTFGPAGQAMRYGLAFTLMDDGYYATTQVSYYNTMRNWFDEFAVDPTTGVALAYPNVDAGIGYLGQPTDPAWPAPMVDGVYARHFYNAAAKSSWLVLLNPKGNGVQTVMLPQPMQKLKGTQVPSVNDGSMVAQVTLQERDGIILKAP